MHGHDVLLELPREDLRHSGGVSEVWPPVHAVPEDLPLGLPDRCDCGGGGPAWHPTPPPGIVPRPLPGTPPPPPPLLVPVALGIAPPPPRPGPCGPPCGPGRAAGG